MYYEVSLLMEDPLTCELLLLTIFLSALSQFVFLGDTPFGGSGLRHFIQIAVFRVTRLVIVRSLETARNSADQFLRLRS